MNRNSNSDAKRKLLSALGDKIRIIEVNGKEIAVGNEVGDLPNGTRIKKINSEPDDTHSDGALGKIIGALGAPENSDLPAKWLYWVEWEDFPGIPVAVTSTRIQPVKEANS